MEAAEEEEREKDRTAAMFYSQCLLSKKGSLAAVWVAACFFKRLKKRQITDTRIPSSVDTIILEGLPFVTYRILAYLLLGVVRIYSRKVEYLFQDYHETVCDINRFSVGKKVISFKNIVQSSCSSSSSIILPEKYELDSFQLEAADVASGNDVQSENVLQDARRDTFEQHSLDKHPSEEELTFIMDENCSTQTSAGVTLQQEKACSSVQTPHKLSSIWEALTEACTPPDKVLSPHQMKVDMKFNSPDHLKASKEKLREMSYTGEECMDFDIICEPDVELLNLINGYHLQNTDEEDGDTLKKAPFEEFDHVLPEEKELPFAAGKTPDSEVPDFRGVQELLLVPTPAKMENIQRACKRKCTIDVPTVLDNQLMKQAINDASDLVCKRRKAPHTVIDLWRISCIPTLSKNFLEPLIPCDVPELRHAHYRKNKEKSEPSLRVVVAERIETVEVPADRPQDVVAPRTPTESRSTIAPGTPVICPVSARIFSSPRDGDSDGDGPFHSYENVKKHSSMYQEEDSGPNLTEEVEADEGDNQEHRNKIGLSDRTRTVARYLHRVIHEKKQHGKEFVPLLPILEHKTRAQNARFFFEILVLTTGGFMNVRQERAYENVLVQETPKMVVTLASG